jgi:hypothetical protein
MCRPIAARGRERAASRSAPNKCGRPCNSASLRSAQQLNRQATTISQNKPSYASPTFQERRVFQRRSPGHCRNTHEFCIKKSRFTSIAKHAAGSRPPRTAELIEARALRDRRDALHEMPSAFLPLPSYFILLTSSFRPTLKKLGNLEITWQLPKNSYDFHQKPGNFRKTTDSRQCIAHQPFSHQLSHLRSSAPSADKCITLRDLRGEMPCLLTSSFRRYCSTVLLFSPRRPTTKNCRKLVPFASSRLPTMKRTVVHPSLAV